MTPEVGRYSAGKALDIEASETLGHLLSEQCIHPGPSRHGQPGLQYELLRRRAPGMGHRVETSAPLPHVPGVGEDGACCYEQGGKVTAQGSSAGNV